MTKRLVTIAGSDALAGGGIQADLATFTEYGYQGLSVLTSIVTVLEDDFNVYPVDTDVVVEQLQSVFALDDIAAVKTGLIPNREQIELIADYLTKHVVGKIPIIVDPVMVVKESDAWDLGEVVSLFKTHLLPLATIITPNLAEAELLVGYAINNRVDMERAVQDLQVMGPQAIVIKGGARLAGDTALDMVFDGQNIVQLENQKLDTSFNNGAGCTFASAITANLAQDASVTDSVSDAKDFVFNGIQHGIALQRGDALGNVWQSARRISGGK
ncbi:bifunctional hydroxymethylpyrimidine kinase/phosphomethylpyrimidine kinase [Weissella ceti]|uniref:pyridoxal kinase n=1 Tax=Weissella ceti TaxID=759620 RepID=A0ABT3E3E2_9LACO|nr:bifunctional hydroxymethylpyrimidine kinase/phosphomethylpyrimidine kinase [Weissella ceti]MCW0952935.1 bifunctional hydroxymethylpyrimidine kinase/phosphomethylpyrimidine kinase [Weissella ceti]QVK11481.1 bifunctional hydroxymethylpyrimidine kinase/phosphomethylpyrimidine kinase [Weissella ceti]